MYTNILFQRCSKDQPKYALSQQRSEDLISYLILETHQRQSGYALPQRCNKIQLSYALPQRFSIVAYIHDIPYLRDAAKMQDTKRPGTPFIAPSWSITK